MNGTENNRPNGVEDLPPGMPGGKRSLNMQDQPPASTILFVGENAETLLLGKRILEKSGALVVETVRSGGLAIEKLQSKKYEGILSDYSLGDMNGIALLRHIRANCGAVPFILFSDEIPREVFTEAFENGADFCVRKEDDLPGRFLLLEEMFGTLIDLLRTREKLHDLQNQKALFMGLSGTSKEASVLLLNTPTGCLGGTLNGGLFFYVRKSAEGNNFSGYTDFITRHNGELTRMSEKFSWLQKQRNRLELKGGQTFPEGIPALERYRAG